MKQIIFLISFSLAATVAGAQDHLDRVWLVGYNEYPGVLGSGQAKIRFDGDTAIAEVADLNMNFESTMAVVVSEQGNVLFYTNGCTVNNAEGQSMPNGAGLNPGNIFDMVCTWKGYISPRGATALPAPGNDHLYYLIHMGVRYDTIKRISYGPLYYSLIDMSQDGGKGDIVSKNNVLVDGLLEPYDIVRHGNGRDWWLVVPEYGTNRYHTFLLSPEGVNKQPTQEIGLALTCKRIGSTAFSPDGSRFARYQNCRAEVSDFDRCSGQLNLYRTIELPEHLWGGGGVAFSPNGESLFFTSQFIFWQTDLSQNPAVPDTALMLDYDWGTVPHLMQYAPNGRVYLNTINRASYFSAVHNPQAMLGEDVNFKFADVSLPVVNVRTLPHFPNFRLYDLPDSPCDTIGINGPPVAAAEPEGEAAKMSLAPNPASGLLTVRLAGKERGTVTIADLTGKVLLAVSKAVGQETMEMNIENIPSGIYIVSFQAGSARSANRKLVVQH